MSFRGWARDHLFVGTTAEATALFRAAGALTGRGPDRLAARLLPWAPSPAMLVKVPVLRHLVPAALGVVLPGAVGFEVRRTTYMDRVLVEEIHDGARQAVILGAGFDSRAHRLADELADTLVFEVDHPRMSARKQTRVRAALARPGNARYIGVDLEHDDLAESLARNGFDPAVRTVVIWSGVTPYLEPGTVAHTLAWVAGLAPDSCVVFDYVWREVVDGTSAAPHAAAVRRSAAARGEPWLCGLPRGEVPEFLAAHGLAADQVVERDPDAEPGWHFGGVARARVPV
jgi:methyltransferase (TIGR00027 family)